MLQSSVKILRKILLVLLSLSLILFLASFLFVTFSPQFGGNPSEEQMESFEKLDHYSNGEFHNLIETNMDMDVGKAIKMLPEFFKKDPTRVPDFEIPIVKVDSIDLTKTNIPTRLIWFGHSAFLLQIDGKNILLDPMLSEVPAPHPMLGKKRFSKELPIQIEELPQIDMIIFSHDHYDHLDYESVQKLMGKTKEFYVPFGVGSHLEAWGIDRSKIHEMDWWDEVQVNGLKLAFTPSKHFSGRGLNNRFSTLWGSWVIKGSSDNIYFSGDGGYGPHFKEIGEKYGPFDFAMMECGQYNERWKEIHMMPEETAQAGKDIQAKVMMPIHWAAFTLAMHSWTDPVERVFKKAEEIQMPVFVPKIGEYIDLNGNLQTQEFWWIKP
ncbi:L-ascorbate metabolism protein UlaG (beta-lactamase superfamily) [Algoriphagus iocasae]|uniref:L-ascorbate metabolism protein UlaG (Beta-lactamase superfamily) n=1 Tax=Algoriphagus iocasae TaxID=1836499 RepID=A0A841MN63_9BACT|nr:MBL fold metallo-hydrolase [Algoriphagus iocasae]MBB6328373.1 L-ascorbate metabolism protein UlaG (beta-lactamase superfamily) [Algoriphagus iocasae]